MGVRRKSRMEVKVKVKVKADNAKSAQTQETHVCLATQRICSVDVKSFMLVRKFTLWYCEVRNTANRGASLHLQLSHVVQTSQSSTGNTEGVILYVYIQLNTCF